MNSETIRWGIVGPGGIARKFARDLRVAEGASLQMIASRDLGRAKAFANEFGAEKVTDDLSEMTAAEDVDIVYIASPHPSHFAAAKRMLEAGKPVLCEKPLTVNAAQSRELIQISRTNKVFLMEAMWTRCLPIYDRVREWLDGGRIGVPQLVTSQFCFPSPYDPTSRWFDPESAGGSLLDLGVYNLAMSQLVMGRKPAKVSAVARMASSGVDEKLSASMVYENGGIAQFTCGLRTCADNSLTIGGEKGFIRVLSGFMNAEEAFLTVDGHTESAREPLRGEGFEFEIEEAMRCLRAGEIESPKMPHADTLATMEVMDDIRWQIGLRYPCE